MVQPINKKEHEQPQPAFSVVEVAKTTDKMISDGENVYTVEEALGLILNKLDNMEKKIVG